MLAPEPAPTEQKLLVETNVAGGRGRVAIDKRIQLGETSEYRAQRVQRVTVGGKTLELDGPFSAPVRVEAQDIFPPSTPTGLAAVASSWRQRRRDSDRPELAAEYRADLAGYAVYRRESAAAGGGGAWQKIPGATPLAGPGYHDTNAQAGQRMSTR